MAAIRGSHTKPELVVRKALHAAGLRYRLHVKNIPGKPDMVFKRWNAVVFVNGCFWHHHDCHLFRWPATREEFWKQKITRNVENDKKVLATLRRQGWRIATVWECSLKGRTRLNHTEAMNQLADWIKSDEESITLRGK